MAALTDHPLKLDGLTLLGAAYTGTLQALLRGDEAAAKTGEEELLRFPDSAAEKEKYYPGLGVAVQALGRRDMSALAGAIDKMLERHAQYGTKGHLRGLEGALICLPAACLAILAASRGMPPPSNVRMKHVKMKFPVTGLEMWEGKPTKGLSFELEVNCFPTELYQEKSG